MKKLENLLLCSVFAGAIGVSALPAQAASPVIGWGGDGGQYLPIGWIDGDISQKLISRQEVKQGPGSAIVIVPSDSSAGYTQIRTSSLDLKAGIYGGWYLQSSSVAASLLGGGIAILPTAGSTVVSERFLPNSDGADDVPALQIPAHAEALRDWKAHDSVFYKESGGLIFSAAIGYAFNSLSGDYYAEGDWSTYVEKLDSNKVFVKISNLSLRSFDLMAGNYLINEMLSDFNKSDNFFSYIFDLSDARAANAYEQMIHGSIREAAKLAKEDPAVAQLDLTENGTTSGDQAQFTVGIPFLNFTATSGELYNFSDTIYNTNKSKTDVEYGLYWNESHSDVFSHHVASAQSFYGTSYKTTAADGSTAAGKFGKLVLTYENDQSDGDTIPNAVGNMIERTGLRNQLKITGSLPGGDLGYTLLTLTVQIPEAATNQLIEANARGDLAISADDLVDTYFNALGDPEGFCDPQVITNTVEGCQGDYRADTEDALNDLQDALTQMRAANSAGDKTAFVKAYAQFGKAVLKNEFVFTAVTQLIHGAPIDITFEAEGTKIAKLSHDISVTGPASSIRLN